MKIPFKPEDENLFVIAGMKKDGSRIFWSIDGSSKWVPTIDKAYRFESAIEALHRFHRIHEKEAEYSEYTKGIFVCKIQHTFVETISLDELELEMAEKAFEYYCEDIPEWRARATQLALDQTGKKFYPQRED